MNLAIESHSSHARRAARPEMNKSKMNADYKRATGHAFSASNPHGKRAAGDKRQFARI